MISRYKQKEISDLWTDEAKFRTFLEVELAILKALEGKKIPQGISDKIRESAVVHVDRIKEIEETVKHDVIAFCTSITENMEPEISKYFHFGVTSSDIIDTAQTLMIKRSLDQIFPVFKELLKSLLNKSLEMKDVLCMGRSHGMFAEPMSFGVKFLGHYAELFRRYRELKHFYDNDLTAQFSGSVGNYAVIGLEAEQNAALTLGLQVEPVSTQVIPRDRIAKLIGIHSLIASAIERFVVEIRHLHRSEVGEVCEGFSKGQKGSSIMPHKKNPIGTENLTGLARVLRSHYLIASENIVLWHERDISHSSTERLYLPDNFGILYYSLNRLKHIINDLLVFKERIEEKVEKESTYLSSYYLHYLIEKTDLSREDLYSIVQKASFEGAEKGQVKDFHASLISLMEERGIRLKVPYPSLEETKKIFLHNVDQIFQRTLEYYSL